MERLPLALYNIASCAALPLALPLLALHPRLRGGLAQRLGRTAVRPRARTIWMHGSSAGDVAALIPVGRRLTSSGFRPTYSVWTRTGHEMAARRLGGGEEVFRVPLDLAPLVGQALDRLRPSLLVLECLEVWPSLVGGCARRGIPVAVVNGRMSEGSLRRYRRAAWLFAPCFRSLALVSALSAQDAVRFVRAGVPGSRVSVESSSKHAALEVTPRAAIGAPVLVLGSVHRGELRELLPWIPRLLARVAGLRVVVVPRYPHNAPAARRLLERLAPFPAQRVTVVDTMGDLVSHYRGATVAFVGGSLVPHGGHNMMEAAAQGAAVLSGPYTSHCAVEAERLVGEGAAAVVCDGADFHSRALGLLLDPGAAAQKGRRGQQVALELRGAADRIARRLLHLVRE